jgi:dihydrofolate reductase
MKISIYMASSANGLISNARGVPDWLSQEYSQGFMAICQKTKAVIMGKTSYNILAPDYLPLKDDGTTVVLTNDIDAKPPNPTVVFTNKTPGDIVSMLEEKGHTEAVIIGGTMTVSEFIQAGIVDDIYFVVEPVLFGSGLPLLKGIEFEYKLSLLEVMKLNANTVQLHYTILK